jgi:NAD(P)-dependent dehydrogenase (short-subunit alcohol dehydrogenase family)
MTWKWQTGENWRARKRYNRLWNERRALTVDVSWAAQMEAEKDFQKAQVAVANVESWDLASIAGLFGSSGDMQMIAYNTSKGAVVNFTRALAGSWGRYGITANALAPGFFPSRMTKGTIEAVGVEKLAAGAPLRRIGDEDDLKGAAVLFASDAGKHITGQILAVDGGLTSVISG